MRNRQPLYQSFHIDISQDRDGGYLYVDWKGAQTAAMVQAGCETMLRILIVTETARVLNDNTNVVGSWQEAADWVARDWFPRMQRAGLRCFAWVQSSSQPSRDAANQSAMTADRDRLIWMFDDRRSAEVWLDAVC